MTICKEMQTPMGINFKVTSEKKQAHEKEIYRELIGSLDNYNKT